MGSVQERGEPLRERLQAALPRREGLLQDHLEGAQRKDALAEGEQAARQDGLGPLSLRDGPFTCNVRKMVTFLFCKF